jgi:hypothetical protein
MKNADRPHRERAFQIHAIAFVVTVAALAVVNVLIGPPYWIAWVVLGWGVGLFSHWRFGLRRAPNT